MRKRIFMTCAVLVLAVAFMLLTLAGVKKNTEWREELADFLSVLGDAIRGKLEVA